MVTRYVVLFGDPVEGNPTSRMQNAAFEAAGLDWRYLDMRVRAPDLGPAVAAARLLEFGGLNLTVPHKVAVIPLLDGLEPSAQVSGACNTVVRRPDGRLVGSNTDGSGFLLSLRDEGVDPSGLEVVILGSGGAARAVSVELALAGAGHVSIAGRDEARRDELVTILRERTSVRVTALAWRGVLAVPRCDVLVDCTPVGMGRGPAALEVVPVDLSGLPPETIVCDLNPERRDTAFLRLARGRGHRTLDGLGMLARQGAAGFLAWTGEAAPLPVMMAELERVAAEQERDWAEPERDGARARAAAEPGAPAAPTWETGSQRS
jgi:shikimate dehydrogenase